MSSVSPNDKCDACRFNKPCERTLQTCKKRPLLHIGEYTCTARCWKCRILRHVKCKKENPPTVVTAKKCPFVVEEKKAREARKHVKRKKANPPTVAIAKKCRLAVEEKNTTPLVAKNQNPAPCGAKICEHHVQQQHPTLEIRAQQHPPIPTTRAQQQPPSPETHVQRRPPTPEASKQQQLSTIDACTHQQPLTSTITKKSADSASRAHLIVSLISSDEEESEDLEFQDYEPRAQQPPPTSEICAQQPPSTPETRAQQQPPTPETRAQQQPPTPETRAQQQPPTPETRAQQQPPTTAGHAQHQSPTPETREQQQPPTPETREQQQPPTPETREQQQPPTPETRAQQQPPTSETRAQQQPPTSETREQQQSPTTAGHDHLQPPTAELREQQRLTTEYLDIPLLKAHIDQIKNLHLYRIYRDHPWLLQPLQAAITKVNAQLAVASAISVDKPQRIRIAQILRETAYAFTLNLAQLSWAILKGYKISENRDSKWKTGWYAVHTGSHSTVLNPKQRKHRLHLQKSLPNTMIPNEDDLLHSAILGLVHICERRKRSECGGRVWATRKWCHIIDMTIKLSRPVYCRGFQGLWRIGSEQRVQIFLQLNDVEISKNDLSILN